MEEIGVGSVLICEPFMRDSGFKRSVILLCDYVKDEGTVGYVINKPMNLNINEVIEDFPEFEAQIFYGGPVASDTLHFLHTKGELIRGAIEVSEGIYWGGDFEEIKFLIKTQVLTPNDISFYLGYSGWSAGQLEDELAYGSWISSEMDRNFLFRKNMKDLWKLILEKKGKHFTVISTMPDSLYQN